MHAQKLINMHNNDMQIIALMYRYVATVIESIIDKKW